MQTVSGVLNKSLAIKSENRIVGGDALRKTDLTDMFRTKRR